MNYATIKQTLEEYGAIVHISRGPGNSPAMWVYRTFGEREQQLLVIYKQVSGWYLHFGVGCYKVPSPDCLPQLCLSLADSRPISEDFRKPDYSKTLEVVEEYSLQPVDRDQLTWEQGLYGKQLYMKRGWRFLDRREEKHCWDLFVSRFSLELQDRRDPVCEIQEPPGSITWSIAGQFGMSPESLQRKESLKHSMVTAFQKIVPTYEPVLAIQREHQGYGMAIHDIEVQPEEYEDLEVIEKEGFYWWPISIADTEYCFFMTPDLQQGLFVNPREESLCAIGETFVSEFSDPFLTKVLRDNR